MIDEILAYNKQFVEKKGYEEYITNKYPDKKNSDSFLHGYPSDSIASGCVGYKEW